MTGDDDSRALRTLLDRATDRVDNPHLASRALASARRRRARGRAVALAGLAAAVTVAVAGVSLSRPNDASPVNPTLAPASSPVTPSDPAPTGNPQPTDPPSTQEPQDVQPQWDPRDVDDLPLAEGGSRVPFDVTPPDTASRLEEAPIDSAVVSIYRGSDVVLLTPDGQWRSVPVPDPNGPTVSLSPRGIRLAVPTSDGVDVWDITTGAHTTLDKPRGYTPTDYETWEWLDDDTLLFDDADGGWTVEVASGTSTRVPYPTVINSYWWTVDPDGSVLESGDYESPAVLTDWAGGEPSEIAMTATGRLLRPAASRDAVAATSLNAPPASGFAVVVADRGELRRRAVLPIRDHQGNYSNWALGTIAVADDDSVVLWVAVPSRDDAEDGWRLVKWQPVTGSLYVLARSEADPTWEVSFANAALH
jgi:hypothetical protein